MTASSLAILLAAGQSKRMKSAVPKVLHPIFGRPVIEYVLEAARQAGAKKIVVVVGYRADLVKAALASHADVDFAYQAEQKGTGHAVMMCESQIQNHEGPVLILAGDTPLLQGKSLSALLNDQADHQASCVIGSAVTEANFGLGRIVRGSDGSFRKIVEQKDATPEEAAITEINTGCYAFDSAALLNSLEDVRPTNIQKEYYLTDCPAILLGQGAKVLASPRLTITEAMGINTRAQLADVTEVLLHQTLQRLMDSGVSIVSPAQTYIDPRAEIGQDCLIHPFCTITGEVKIGENCQIGPHAVVSGPITLPEGTVVRPFEVRSA